MNALEVVLTGFTSRQSTKQSLPDFTRDFESRLGLLDVKFKDEYRIYRHLMSPVLLCAPTFAQEVVQKDYDMCNEYELEKVHKATADKIKACLFLLLSRNSLGTTNKEMLKEKHN